MELFKIRQYIKYLIFDDTKRDVKTKLNKSGHKAVLIGQPVHSNLGDYAIINAELDFISEINKESDVIVISMPFFHTHKNYLKKRLSTGDLIMISGGGWMGDLWPINELVIQDIVNTYKENTIIIFPQTVFFEKKGELYKKAMSIYGSHKNLHIFARDKKTYDFLINDMDLDGGRCYLVPDIVYSLKCNIVNQPRNGVCFCLRKDSEKVSGDEEINDVLDFFIKQNYQIFYTDTVLKKRNDKISKNKMNVYKKITEFSKYKVVVTDRLHGMIFSLLSKTPCIVFDNKTKKVSESLKWINGINSVLLVQSEVDESSLYEFINRNFIYYDLELIKEKYKPLIDIVNKYL